MRPWRARLAVRRSRVQWALLAVVLAVSILAGSLLATLYLLSAATETFAARTALTDAEAQDTTISLRVTPEGSLETILAAADAAVEEVLGDVPYTRTVTTQGDLLVVDRGDRPTALAYLGSTDALDERVRIQSGAAPQVSSGPVQILVPPALLYDVGATVGDLITLAPFLASKSTDEFLVVGTYTVADVADPAWQLDLLHGATHDPSFMVPFTFGAKFTDAYGPLYTVHEDVEAASLDLILIDYVPNFADTSLSEVRAVLQRGADIERTATLHIADAADSVAVTTSLPATLGGVAGSLAVTRSSVLVTGLLLLVLTIAALSQTARLMAERRHAEQHLMIARGSSGRQLFQLGFIEAIALGVVTAVASAPLARLAYLALAQLPVMQQAGMAVDPGIPPQTWVVTAVAGLVLVTVLVAPLLRRQSSFIEAEQTRSRPGRRTAFQRSGLDLAVLALAALAYWQLRNYRSPVLASGDVATVDPLLAAGPALALLAGALVAVRLIPPAAKVLEVVAARGRKAVLPLAAWEVGRRSARAVSAVLLLTLAVSIGTFAATFLTTWQQSQQDQALYRHPPDAVVWGVDGPWLSQRAKVQDGTYATTASAVVRLSTLLGATPQGGAQFNGSPATLVATDANGLAMYGAGRLNEIGGARIPATLGDDVPVETSPIEIPGKPSQLAMDVTAEASQYMGDIQLLLRAVVRNSAGDYQTIAMGQIPLDGEQHHLVGTIASTADLADHSTPMYLVGIQSTWVSMDGGNYEFDFSKPFAFTVAIDSAAALTPVASVPAAGQHTTVDVAELDLSASLDWTRSASAVGVNSLTAEADQLDLTVLVDPVALMNGPGLLVLTAAEKSSPVPLVASGAAIDKTHVEVGDAVTVLIGTTSVPAYVAQRVPTLAGPTLGQAAVVANIARLQVATIQAGGAVVTPSQWWIGVDAANLDAYADTLPPAATMTSQAGLAEEFTNDPLRVAIQAALWLVTGAAAILAALGFAVHAIVTVRARELELAQLRAIGVLRGQLLRIITSENGLLSALGLVFGLGLGIALSYLVAPLVSVGPDGRPPLPPVIVEVPWAALGLLAAEVALVLLVSTVIVSIMVRRIKPAQLLRLGDER